MIEEQIKEYIENHDDEPGIVNVLDAKDSSALGQTTKLQFYRYVFTQCQILCKNHRENKTNCRNLYALGSLSLA